VMERLEGETLSMLLHRQRRLLPQQALGIAAGILDGLHAAHQIGVVHRDVKPPNIFLTGPLAVKVLDFGIAKIKDAKDVITARGIAVGTPRYMSPEQARGTAVDARSDIYATGLMLFEMVSGVGPYDDARDHNELLVRSFRGRRRSCRACRSSLRSSTRWSPPCSPKIRASAPPARSMSLKPCVI
jgi:serine/threonine protein kinase